MSYAQYFEEELNNSDTRYFSFDVRRSGEDGDVDFIRYQWPRRRFPAVREGDLCLFRRPKSASETHEFYFYGAAKIGAFTEHEDADDRVTAQLVKPYPFQTYLYAESLKTFPWKFRQRGDNWASFFSQFGMNQITRDDFVGILELYEGMAADPDYDPRAATEAVQAMQGGNYSVDDDYGWAKVRSKQSIFSREVKANYNNQCALCDMKTGAFLIGSHIVPWSVRKETRLDPTNGICLCAFHDRAFDAGYIAIDQDLQVIVSTHVGNDAELASLLAEVRGQKLRIPRAAPPKQEYLDYHRAETFEKWLRAGVTKDSDD